jgi:hypothetical protein
VTFAVDLAIACMYHVVHFQKVAPAMLLEFESLWTIPALRYSFAHSGERVTAQCAELIISASGRSQEDAVKTLNALVLYQINQW